MINSACSFLPPNRHSLGAAAARAVSVSMQSLLLQIMAITPAVGTEVPEYPVPDRQLTALADAAAVVKAAVSQAAAAFEPDELEPAKAVVARAEAAIVNVANFMRNGSTRHLAKCKMQNVE